MTTTTPSPTTLDSPSHETDETPTTVSTTTPNAAESNESKFIKKQKRSLSGRKENMNNTRNPSSATKSASKAKEAAAGDKQSDKEVFQFPKQSAKAKSATIVSVLESETTVPTATTSEEVTAPDDDNNNGAANANKAKKTMTEMVHDAILALKDRTGSSQIAIQKYILATFPSIDDNNTFRSRLAQTLKKGIAASHFQKIKASYKISAEWNKKAKAKRAKDAMRKAAEKKKRDSANQAINNNKKQDTDAKKNRESILESMKESMTQEELDEIQRKHDLKVERQRVKDEMARKEKEKQERLKRRRFPMEDTRLHEEDKEFGITTTVKRRPAIPYFFQIVRDSKSTAQTPSRCDAVDFDTRGLVPDLLQVYHFFRGDMRFCDLTEPKMVCDFTLSHLIYAVDEVLIGNARKSKLVPPLLQHLFLCCLSFLTAPAFEGDTREQKQLSRDLEELADALSPASWPEICIMYMECMDRYYKSPASQDASVLPPGSTDISYLFRVTDTPITSALPSGAVPDGYFGYFGNPKSTLAKAFDKLNRQDVWTLQADELMALLRALTDDVIATRPDVMEEISGREVQLAALVRDKRSADANYRKIKLGLEGPPPKKPAPKKKDEDDNEEKKVDKKKNGKVNDKENEATAGVSDKPFKPTTTKKQLEQAKRDQRIANEAYERGMKTLVARSEPFGSDRHFNHYYWFPHDPEFIFVEMNRSVTGLAEHLPTEVQMLRTSWHAIDKVSMLDLLASSLDVRGYRERALHESLVGTSDAPQQALKKYVYDDVMEKNAIENFEKEREEVEQKLEGVRLNILRLEEEGRRASRFQTDQIMELESQIAVIEKKIANASIVYVPDYIELTGLDTLRKFDAKAKRHARRLESEDLAPMPCTMLVPTRNNNRTGIVGWIVDEILHVEALCQDLVPWEAAETRKRWIADLEKLAASWNESTTFVVGPENKDSPAKTSQQGNVFASPDGARESIGSVSRQSTDGVKRQKLDSSVGATSQLSLQHIITQAKQPLLDLEERIYQVSGLAMADNDQNIADDNMSDADEGATEEALEREQSKTLMAWRKKAHLIKVTPAKKPGVIREALIQAIAAARKAHLGQIVSQLRSALLLYHSDAAGECKQAVIAILEEHGGYDPEDEDEEENNNNDNEEETKSEGDAEEVETPVPSNLCFEAVSLLGSLGDDDKATRSDWTDSVRQCKSLTRFAALSTAFCRKATAILEKLMSERQSLEKALDRWQREDDRKKRAAASNSLGKKNNRKVVEPPTEMWANVDYTNEFCMVRLENHPWWPAKKCVAKDVALQESLRSFDRVLVAMVGEHGELRCVKNEDARVFTGSAIDDDLEGFSKEDQSQLEESLAIARRIIRGQAKNGDADSMFDEKKTGF